MKWYTGRIHSEHLANTSSKYYAYANSHGLIRTHVTFYLGKYSVETATNILRLRNAILLLARDAGQENSFELLKEYDDRCKEAGY